MSEAESANASDGGKEAETPQDPIDNLKHEFSRKYGNVEQKLSDLEQTNRALAEQLAKFQAPAPKAASTDIDPDEVLTNTGQFVNKLVSKVEQAVESRFENRNKAESERVQVLQSLMAEYPELQQADSELYKETMAALGGLPENQRNTSQGYQTAVFRAAASLALPPKQKRQKKAEDGGDDFSFKGGKNSGPKKTAKPDLPAEVLRAAQLMGINIDDEKEIEDLKKHTKRNFSRFE